MAVAFRSGATAKQDGGSATISAPVPAGTAAGDLLVVVFSQDYDADATNYPTPSGWALAGTVQARGSGQYQPGCAVFWRFATGSEPASYPFTGVSSSSKVLVASAWTGVDTTTPFAVAPTFQVVAAGTTHATPSVAAGAGQDADDVALFYAASDYYDTSQNNSYTAPSGTTIAGQTSSTYVYGAVAYLALTGTSAVGSRTFTANRASQDPAQTMAAVLNAAATNVTKNVADQAAVTDQAATSATIPSADAVTVSDSAAVGELHSAAEQASVTDSASTTATQPAADTAAVQDSMSSQATLPAGDTAAVTESMFSQATLPIADQASVTDVAKPGPKTADSASVNEQVTSTAYFGRNDSVTISEGASVEGLYGDLVVSLWGVDPSTGALVALPDWTKLTLSPARNGPGAITIDYPTVGLNFAWLYANTVGRDADLEVEVWNFGSKTGAIRWLIQEAGGDDVDDEAVVWTFAGGGLELRAADGEVYPQPLVGESSLGDNVTVKKSTVTAAQWTRLTTTLGYQASSDADPTVNVPQKVIDAVKANAAAVPVLADPKRELKFTAVTPGALVGFLLVQARARGALTDIATSFTNTTDSSGAAWPAVLTTKYSPGAKYDAILGSLVTAGRIEWSLTWDGTRRVLNLWVPGNRGVDRTVGNKPVILRAARNLTEAPRKWSVRNSSTAMLGIGAEGYYQDTADLNAQARRGRRIEDSASSQNLITNDAVLAFAQRQLAVDSSGTLEVTHGLAMLPGEPRPLVAFDVGDWIYSQTTGGLDRLRVVSWSLTVDALQQQTATVTLNDTHTDAVSRLKAQLSALTSGETVAGTSTASNQTDTTAPSPPTGLLVSSGAFNSGIDAYAVVLVAWSAPVTNVDGSALTNLAGYRVEWTEYANPTKWRSAANVDQNATQAQFTTATGLPILVRVAAYKASGATSTWLTLTTPHTTETDSTPPPVPSAPVGANYLGLIQYAWDGKSTAGADMFAAAPDFAWCELHLSTTSNFTPDSTTLADKVFGKGTYTYAKLPDGSALTYGTSYYCRLVSVDLRGNRQTTPSGQGSATPGKLVNLDLGPNAVARANIVNAAIGNAQIDVLAVNDAQIMNVAVGKLTAGILTASMIVGTGKIATGTSGARVEIDTSGLRLYDANGNVNVQLKTADGSAIVSGEYRTTLTTGKRMVFNPNGSAPDEIRFYPASTNQYGRMRTITSVASGFENQAGMTIKAFSPASDGESGEVSAFPSFASIAFANEMESGNVTTRLAASSGNAFIGGPKVDISYSPGGQVYLGCAANNAYFPRNTLRVASRDGGSNSNVAIGCDGPQHAFLQFDTQILSVVNDTSFINIQANAFTVGSERRTKTAIEQAPFDPVDAVRSAGWYRYEKLAEAVAPGADRTKQLGLMLDELPDEVKVYSPDQDSWSVDIYGVLAILWGAVRDQIGHLELTSDTVQLLDRLVRGTHLRGVA